MNPEVKAKWVTALRSGNYQQGTGQLRSSCSAFGAGPDQFCCLGVLCDIIEPGAWKADGTLRACRHHGERGQPSVDLLSNVGLLTHFDDGGSPVGTLVSMNDDDRATFEVIADWIEANL